MRVKVRSVHEKFRRAGHEFTKAPRELEVDKKTLDILQAESMLVVEVLPDPAPAKPEKPEGKDEKKDEKEKGKGK